MSEVWSNTHGTQVPARFRYAMFPELTELPLPITRRAVLNSERERTDSSDSYEVHDDNGFSHQIKKSVFTLLPERVDDATLFDTLNTTLQRWGADTDMHRATFSANEIGEKTVYTLEIKYRDDHTAQFKYRVVDGIPEPISWHSSSTLGR